MARARNIKPGFFLNTELAEIPPIGRLAFIGMWTIADYKGCIECNFKKMKAQVLPYDDCDLEEITNYLEQYGFIRYYSVQGKRYIKIANFELHQNPHKNEREAGSKIPDIDEEDEKQANNNHLKESGTRTELGRNSDGTARADSLLLIPDSLIQAQQATPRLRGSRLPEDWELPEDWKAWALAEQPSWNDEHVRKVALAFRNYWTSKSGKDAAKLKWFATWQNWVMKEPAAKSAKPVEWWSSDSATEAKGREIGLSPRAGEGWPQFRDRIRAKLSERAHA